MGLPVLQFGDHTEALGIKHSSPSCHDLSKSTHKSQQGRGPGGGSHGLD